jgi:hypothetical protein
VPDALFGQKVQCPTCGDTFFTSANTGSPQPSTSAHEGVPPRSSASPLIEREERLSYEEPPPMRRPPAPADEERYAVQPPDHDEQGEEPPHEPAFEADEEPQPDDWRKDSLAGVSNRYSIYVGEWFDYAKEHYSAVLGPMIAYTAIYIAIDCSLGLVPFVSVLTLFLLDPVLQAGYVVVCLAQLKGKPWSFGDFFSGFQRYGALIGNFFITFGIVFGFLLLNIIVLAVARAGPAHGFLPLAIVFMVLTSFACAYVLLRATCFNVWLIIDRGCGPFEAIQGSWTISRDHFWGLFGSLLVVWIVGGIGVLLCGIGVLFTWPLYFLAKTAGYLLIAGTRRPRKTPRVSRRIGSDEEFGDEY